MPDPIHWLDVDEISLRLLEAHPEIDPLTVRFTDLKKMVSRAPGLRGEARPPAQRENPRDDSGDVVRRIHRREGGRGRRVI